MSGRRPGATGMRRPRPARVAPALLLLALWTAWASPAPAETYSDLPLDVPLRSLIDWEEQTWRTFLVEVPDDALVLTLTLTDAPVDLDLFARHGAPIESYSDDAEHRATSYLYNEEMRISRLSVPGLEPGTYYVDVSYTLDAHPRIGKERVSRIPFTIQASVIRARVDGVLEPGVPQSSRTDAEGGWFRSYVVNVPPGAEALRIDLDGATSDLDIAARRGEPVLALDGADHRAEAVLGRETLLIEPGSDPPLQPGRWYVDVYDPFELPEVPFTVRATLSRTPPEELLAFPAVPDPRGGLERALLATVELVTRSGSGSGTLLSADGWILTNYHVVEDDAGGVAAEGDVVVSLSLDPRQPPAELFRGNVVEADDALDLALVKVATGLYGQPLPEGFHFPYQELGDSETLAIGAPLSLAGFPGVGGLGGRASINLTRGVVSGFDTSEGGLLIKTDADISAGNSGGAALDGDWRLIGVPVSTVEETNGNAQVGFVIPMSRVPASWWDRIRR